MLATLPPPPVAPSLSHRVDPRRDPSGALGRSWWLCRVNARQEKAAAAELLAADVPHLLPMRSEIRYCSRSTGKRTRQPYRVAEALFPGYLFLAGDDLDYFNARQCRRTGWLIPVFDVAGLVRDLSSLLDAIETMAEVGPCQDVEPGEAVRVVSGPLEGQQGVLVRRTHGGHVLLLHVRCLGQVVPVEVEAHRCEPVGE